MHQGYLPRHMICFCDSTIPATVGVFAWAEKLLPDLAVDSALGFGKEACRRCTGGGICAPGSNKSYNNASSLLFCRHITLSPSEANQRMMLHGQATATIHVSRLRVLSETQ